MPATMSMWTEIPLREAQELDQVLDLTHLTRKQAQVLRYIAWHITKRMAPPTYSELSAYMGDTSYSCCKAHVNVLISKGKLEESPTSKRLQIVGVTVRLFRA
jgi:SOS-response transcriptional repressor LexA